MAVGADNFADATPIGLATVSDPTSNTTYNKETGEPGYATRTAWWSFTPPTDGWIRFDAQASTYADATPGAQTHIGVYIGASVGALTLVAERDVFDGEPYSLIRFAVTAGTQYWVKIGSVWDEDLIYVLTISDYAVLGDWIDDPDNTQVYAYSGEFYPHADGPEFGPARPGWQSHVLTEAIYDETATAPAAWDATWAGGGDIIPAAEAWSEQQHDSSVPGQFDTLWIQGWSTLHRADGPTVTEGAVPFGLDEDPDFATLEWEPTSTPISQDVIGTFQNAQGSGTGYVQIKVAQVSDTEATEPVVVPFYTAAEATALETVATVTGLTTPSFTNRTFAGGVTGLPLSGPATVVLGVIDSYVVEQGTPLVYAQQLLTSAQIRGIYAPRYRQLRWDVVAPPTLAAPVNRVTPSLRMLQRGGSGGMSGIPRMIGDPTRRGSVRQGPGSIY